MSMIARRLLIIPAVLLVAVAAGYGVLWLVVSHWVEEGFRDWSKVQASRGNRVDFASLETSGFPGPIRLMIAAPGVTSAKGGWHWSAERAVLETLPWDWRRYRLEVFGTQTLAVPFAGELRRYTVRSASTLLIGEVDDRGRLTQGFLRAVDVPFLDEAKKEVVSAKSLDVHMNMRAPASAAQDQSAIDVTIQAHSVVLGEQVETPLGRQIQDIAVVAAIKGALPETFLRDAVDAWRESGGTLELSHFQMDWGKLSIRANGTVALDEALRPLAALTTDIKGYAETLAALEQARLLRRKDAAGTRLALDLLSRRDGGDNRRMVTIPVTIQNGLLYVGPVRLLRLAPIPFPVRPD